MALATVATTAPQACLAALSASVPFTRWHRDMDGSRLSLVVESGNGAIAECVELDVRELPSRRDLLVRLGPVARERLLREAYEAPQTDDEREFLRCLSLLDADAKRTVFALVAAGIR